MHKLEPLASTCPILTSFTKLRSTSWRRVCSYVLACSTLCDPYLNLFRGIIPPLGGTLDFSPILAFVLLSVSPFMLCAVLVAFV
jgi:uncharacterized protein YggT (Ycf19 family)